MSNNTNTIRIGNGFTSLLAVLFIGLKLTGYITWSWWWVLSPFWIPVVIVILMILTGLAVACLIKVLR